jgi:hypothetical protein
MLRKALGGNGDAKIYMETVSKRGYRFVGELVEISNANDSVSIAAEQAVVAPPKTWRLWGAAALVSTVLVAVLWISTPHRQALAPAAPYRLVAAEFVNRTGDPEFEGSLDQGLSIQLQQSPKLTLISDSEIRRTLRLMNQSPRWR